MENGTNGKWQLLFVGCKQKQKTAICLPQMATEVCSPWSSNDKRKSTIAV
jgi:hypothetical protein